MTQAENLRNYADDAITEQMTTHAVELGEIPIFGAPMGSDTPHPAQDRPRAFAHSCHEASG
jgi:hypothetical protein